MHRRCKELADKRPLGFAPGYPDVACQPSITVLTVITPDALSEMVDR